MSDIELYGLAWAAAALLTIAVSALGLVLQPLILFLLRRRRGAHGGRVGRRQLLGTFLGPLTATIVGVVSMWWVGVVTLDTQSRLDAMAYVPPLVALVAWLGLSVWLLRARRTPSR